MTKYYCQEVKDDGTGVWAEHGGLGKEFESAGGGDHAAVMATFDAAFPIAAGSYILCVSVASTRKATKTLTPSYDVTTPTGI